MTETPATGPRTLQIVGIQGRDGEGNGDGRPRLAQVRPCLFGFGSKRAVRLDARRVGDLTATLDLRDDTNMTQKTKTARRHDGETERDFVDIATAEKIKKNEASF